MMMMMMMMMMMIAITTLRSMDEFETYITEI